MNTILNFVRDYFIFMLVLFLFSYLTPKEEYRKYIQFFVGALMMAILMRPVLAFFSGDAELEVKRKLEDAERDMGQITYYGEGEDIFEWFLEREGLDTEEDEEP